MPDLSLTLLTPRRIRLDIAPYVILYIVGFGSYLQPAPSISATANLVVPVIVACHCLTFLVCHWSLAARCLTQLRRVTRVSEAKCVRVYMPTGHSELCMLEQHAVWASTTGEEETRFEHQKRTYVFKPSSKASADADEATAFAELTMPLGLPLSHYMAGARGLKGEALAAVTYRYGANKFEIPAKTFGALLLEHLLAPFFAFQLFCVLLWSLDDYWYYSLFTLVMLVAFESTVVTSRLRNWDEMRELATPPSAVTCLREGKWTTLSSEDLVPGDIIALARAPETGTAYSFDGELAQVEAVCYADVVLLHGTVTVNESALTGESTPLLKSPIDVVTDDPTSAPFSMEAHKAAVVLGGTKLLQHSSGSQPSALQPPGGGAVGYVLRTGFHSTQGELIRTILFASDRATEHSRETIVFILFLLSFALVAASYVLVHGLADPTRSRFKLILHCTMILTSVVPPELPMELSLAVNNSLLALHNLGIYCTEPFRIPYAGRLHVCCFDKTGVLFLLSAAARHTLAPLSQPPLSHPSTLLTTLLTRATAPALSRTPLPAQTPSPIHPPPSPIRPPPPSPYLHRAHLPLMHRHPHLVGADSRGRSNGQRRQGTRSEASHHGRRPQHRCRRVVAGSSSSSSGSRWWWW